MISGCLDGLVDSITPISFFTLSMVSLSLKVQILCFSPARLSLRKSLHWLRIAVILFLHTPTPARYSSGKVSENQTLISAAESLWSGALSKAKRIRDLVVGLA